MRDTEFNATSGLQRGQNEHPAQLDSARFPARPAGLGYHKVRHCARTGMRIETDVEVREDCEPRVTEHITMSADAAVSMRGRKS